MKMLVLISLVALAGCCTPVTKIQKVEVPIAVPCKTPDPVQPTLAFHPPYTDVFSGTRDLMGDRELTDAYIIELKAALKSCK